ncbi:unnamed protein product (macronuclear) [Paramecium tetraurelia]|uniref:Uncharacterized protein n=1 Tax=Paramecium tetraurelia TaxID=5888 RepID=A0CHD2_PARTE|nr:uncharacterized protein GSPATT00038301001 [Paramecium tetraurelia]CAK70199.1 unnamed protein product [Paramecium tetraurelia]|eukprot:XP_001437596.1 hypothetical protein (macronuclear) [Paramecium tetraurelia strain d4-2]
MESDRLSQSIKFEIEQKQIKQKAQLLSIIDKELLSIKEKLANQVFEDNNNILKYNLKLLQLEKKNAEKHDIMVEQEMILRKQATIVEKQQKAQVQNEQKEIQQINKDDKEEISITQDLTVEIEGLRTRNLYLSHKLSQLLFYFVDLQLYDKEFAKQVALDDFPIDQLYKPSLSQPMNLFLNIEDNEKKKLEAIIKSKVSLLNIIWKSCQNNKKQKLNKKQLFFQDQSTEIKPDQQKRTVFTYEDEHFEDQQYLEQLSQLKRDNQPKCKTLNDIILKKRKYSFDTAQPALDFYKLNRRLIAERFQQPSLQFVNYQKFRIHSQSIKNQ